MSIQLHSTDPDESQAKRSMDKKKYAVVLFQLGGPDSLDAVEPFLFNLFMDPDIIDFPGARFGRKLLAKLISSTRSKKVKARYEEIGGKSPILELTQAQARALEKTLNRTISAKAFIAMRYWHPLTDVAVSEVKKGSFDEIILLPLYPHYSITTTGSSINEWNRQCARLNLDSVPQKLVHHFYDNPHYIEAIVQNVNKSLEALAGIDPQNVYLVFSAHGVPVSIIEKGDPYQRHIENTVQLVLRRGAWPNPHILCYQSKVGPAEWLKPSLNSTISSLAQKGVKHVLVIPVAFVTDHIETLDEINIETREKAEKLGIEHFAVMPALNDHPKFIEALAQEVMKLIG